MTQSHTRVIIRDLYVSAYVSWHNAWLLALSENRQFSRWSPYSSVRSTHSIH